MTTIKKTKIEKMYSSFKLYLCLSFFVIISTFIMFVYLSLTSIQAIANECFLTGFTIFNTVFGITTMTYALYVNRKYEDEIKHKS